MSGRISIDNLSDSLKEMIANSGMTEEQIIELLENEEVIDSLKTNSKSIVGAINELFQSANNGKELIASAIGEPLDASDTFSAMSNDINSLLSTFKTNMMNNGVTVGSRDKFKALIDKIATLADSEGKGIQISTGHFDITTLQPASEGMGVLTSNQLNFNPPLNFTPDRVILSIPKLQLGSSVGGDYTNHSIDSEIHRSLNHRFTVYDENGKEINMYISTVIDGITAEGFVLNAGKNNTNYALTTPEGIDWFAIGVGEEDTTLRDSLADILGDKGVYVTEEDDMASLITKVEGIEQGSRYPKWYTHPGNVISTDKQISVQCYNSSAIACGTNIYCMGGYSGPYGSYHTMNDCYNTVDNTITSKTPLPGQRARMALSSIDKFIYCMGGRDSAGNISVNHIYDTELDTFSDGTSTPFVGSTQNVSAVYNRKIHFIISGNHSCYDPDLNAWTTKNPVTFSVTYAVVAGVIKDKIYILPHYYPTEYVRVYDPALNTWTNKATVSVSGTYGAGGVIDDRLYYAAAYEAYTNINYYDPMTDSFNTPMYFSSRQTNRAAATLNGCLYLFGGCRNNDSSYRSSVIDIYVR